MPPAGVDARFPNVNQTKHCWQNYVDYHKCINAKGEDFKPCRQVWLFAPVLSGDICCADAIQFFLAYRSLCPSGWYNRKFHFNRALDAQVIACGPWAHAAPCPQGSRLASAILIK